MLYFAEDEHPSGNVGVGATVFAPLLVSTAGLPDPVLAVLLVGAPVLSSKTGFTTGLEVDALASRFPTEACWLPAVPK